MVKLDHFDIEILQGGTAANEHKDPAAEETEHTKTLFVEIKEDERFSIRFTISEAFELEPYDGLCIWITIDGVHKGGFVYQDPKHFKADQLVKVIHGFDKNINGRAARHHFRFAETEQSMSTRRTRADESLGDLRDEFKDQGTIIVEVSRVGGYSVKNTDSSKPDDIKKAPKDVVKEKGSTTMTTFEVVEQEIAGSSFVTTEEDPAKSVFHLKYRTIETLRDLDIAPKLVITKPGETYVLSDDEDTSTLRNELTNMKREMEELRQRVKREEADTFKDMQAKKRKILVATEVGETEMTEERSAQRRKPTADDEVIELDD